MCGERRCGRRDRIAPGSQLNEPHQIDRVPLQAPDFVKRPLAGASFLGAAPVDAQNSQAMEQLGSSEIDFAAKVEIDHFLERFGFYPQALLLALEVLLQRDERRIAGHFAKPIGQEQLAADEPHAQVAIEAEDRARRIGDVAQIGQRAPRRLDSALARRVASIAWALEQSMSSARSSRATRVIHRSSVSVRHCQRCSYHPGARTPAP